MNDQEPTTIPMFPLGTVVLPGDVLPLQVFEPRYTQMLTELLVGEPAFGITMIERGSEVGGGDIRADVATQVHLTEAAEIEPGRYAILVEGLHRIEVKRWLSDDPYPKADIVPLPETLSEGDASKLEAVHDRFRSLLMKAVERGMGAGELPELDDMGADDVERSYALARAMPIGPFDRQQVLVAASVGERAGVLDDLIDGIETLVDGSEPA